MVLLESSDAELTMNTAVIDTLKLAQRLKQAGFEPPQAEGLARVLGDEVAERMVTKRDLDDAVRAINATLKAMDGKFESRLYALEPRFDAVDARFDGLEPRFDAIDARFEAQHREFSARFDGLEPRFDAIDARFDGLEPRFDAIDAKLEAQHREFSARFDGLEPRFDAIDAKLEAQHREFSGRFNVLFGSMALGFTLVIGLIGYSLFAPRTAGPAAAETVAIERQAVSSQAPAQD